MAEMTRAGWGRQDVGDALAAGEMTSLDENRRGAESKHCDCGAFHRRDVMNYAAGQDRRFVDVRGNQRRKRKQILADDVLRLGGEQARAGCRNHDGIHDEWTPPVLPDRSSHLTDHGGFGEHAGLESRGRQVFGQSSELGRDHPFGNRFDGAHTQRVLRGERHDH
jgi:hypothetical protein